MSAKEGGKRTVESNVPDGSKHEEIPEGGAEREGWEEEQGEEDEGVGGWQG